MHAVMKDSSTTTKLRVVFDGSAATTSGTSLNQSLLVGPTLQPTLSAILLKFRCYPVAINADISKMYREVLLHPADKDLHRFVWRASPEDPTGCTECLRGECLTIPGSQDPPEDHGEEYPEVISTVSM